MLSSCSYCGRIHDKNKDCEKKKKAIQERYKNRKETKAFIFHHSNKWTEKSIQIRKRDNYMCLCCKAMMKGTEKQYNTNDLSVHHIAPIEEDYEQRLEEENLITVCTVHHKMCEDGKISREKQRKLVKESINAYEK